MFTRWPMASSFGQYFLAMAAFTIITGAEPFTSRTSKMRPRTTGIDSTLKYSAEIMRYCSSP
jgi:hypothetical protein